MLRGRRGYLFEFFFNRSDAPANVFEIERSENCTRDYLEIAAVPPAARLLPDAGTSRSHARGTCTMPLIHFTFGSICFSNRKCAHAT